MSTGVNGGKIVGVGFGKTGTTTLGVCLQTFGYRHQSYDIRAAGMYARGARAELMAWIDRFESLEDFPWCLLYREIDQRYPGSKFILTRRRTPRVWLESYRKHYERAKHTGLPEFRQKVFGHAVPMSQPELTLAAYENHMAEVRHYFRRRPEDLLEVCWETGDGWMELASFLGQPCPQTPFPHANQAPGWRSRLREQLQRLATR